MSAARFGTAGLSASYHERGYKDMKQAPAYTASFGLDAFEYQCGRGVRLAQATAEALVAGGREAGIQYSLHAPYYISMASDDEEKRMASLRYLRESAEAVQRLGGVRVVFHPGGVGKLSREEALARVKDTLQQARQALDDEGYTDILLCPETMGKTGQVGTLDEVLALCRLDDRITPCIDFGHLNARTGGALKTKADYAAVLDAIADALPDARAAHFHVHFSKIEYTAGGEKRHLTFADTAFGPDWEPLVELLCERNLSPVVICESDGTQAEDAATMKRYYESLCK